MPRQPSHDIDIPRLIMSMRKSRFAQTRSRAERVEMVREKVGYHWSEEGTPFETPLNLIANYLSVMGRQLIPKNPRVMLSTFDRASKPTVYAMQNWMNEEIERTRLQNTMARIVTDALISVGIAHVAILTPAESAMSNWAKSAGQAAITRVDQDNWLWDMNATDMEECAYMAHRFRVPIDAVKDSKFYTKARKKLEPSAERLFNPEGDERVNTLGRGMYGTDTEHEDMVDLWSVYVARHRTVLTLADEWITGPSEEDAEVLRVQPWVGPDNGPYYIHGLELVPGNAMPQGPAQHILDLHRSTNRALRKVISSVDNLKELTFYTRNAEDAKRMDAASHLDMIPVGNPEQIKGYVANGGSIQLMFGMANALKQLFNYGAGNIDLLSGSGPQSPTASQDELLNQNASAGVGDMQIRTVDYTSRVLRGLGWFWWHDPFHTATAKHSVPGLPPFGIQVTPQMRQRLPWNQLQFEIDPYSLQHWTPQSRFKMLNDIVQGILAPLMPVLQQQGKAFNVETFLQKAGQYLDQPDLEELIDIGPPPSDDGPTSLPHNTSLPTQTNRTYTRKNVPMRTQRGDDMNLTNTMLGVDTGGANAKGQAG